MRRGILGAVIGVGIGLMVLMAAMVATTGWLLYFYVPELLAVLGGASAGYLIGRRFDRGREPLKRFWAWLALAVVAVPLLGLAPHWARQLQIRWMIARDIPEQQDFALLKRRILTVGVDGPPGYSLSYACSMSPREILMFYREELPKRGWEVLPVVYDNYITHQYRKPGQLLSVISWTGREYPDQRRMHRVRLSGCFESFMYSCPPLTQLGHPPVPPGQEFPKDPSEVPTESNRVENSE